MILEQVDVSVIRARQQLRKGLLLNIHTAVRTSQELVMFNFPAQKMSQTSMKPELARFSQKFDKGLEACERPA